jgi:hypothetical protein
MKIGRAVFLDLTVRKVILSMVEHLPTLSIEIKTLKKFTENL